MHDQCIQNRRLTIETKFEDVIEKEAVYYDFY